MNIRPWESHSDVTADEALRLIQDQCPSVSPQSISLLGRGWDNVAFLIDDHYVFRFPRRPLGAQCMAHEVLILPHLELTSLRIPKPVFVGTFQLDGKPCKFAGYTVIKGQLASECQLTPAARSHLAQPLGTFLSELHRTDIDTAELRNAPGDLIGRLDLPRRISQTDERLQQIETLGVTPHVRYLRDLLDSIKGSLVIEPKTVLCHGDLYSRHIVLSSRNDISGIIDWGDVHLNHPAIDLAVAWKFLPVNCHETFRSAYGTISDDSWLLAQFRALNHLTALLVYAIETDVHDLIHETQFTMENLLAGS